MGEHRPSLTASWAFASILAVGVVWDPLTTAVAAKRVVLTVIALVGVALAAHRVLSEKTWHARWGVGTALWLSFCGWNVATSLWGPELGAIRSQPWLSVALITAIAVHLPVKELRMGSIAGAWGAGTVAATVALLQWTTGSSLGRIHGLQGNPNWLGLLLGVTIFASAEMVSVVRAKLPKVALVLGTTAQVAGLALSGSRTAWIGVAIGATVAWMLKHRDGRQRKVVLAGVPAGLVGLAAIVLGSSWTGNVSWSRGLSGRLWLDGTTLQAATRHFPLGTGLGGFVQAFSEAQGDRLSHETVKGAAHLYQYALTAHNEVLQALLELGLVGGFLLIAAWTMSLRQAWRAEDTTPTALLVAVGVMSLADSPLHLPPVLLLLTLSLATIPEPPSVRSTKSSRTLTLTVAMVAAIVLSWSLRNVTAAWRCERLLTKAKSALPSQHEQMFREATRLAPSCPKAWLALGAAQRKSGKPKQARRSLARSVQLLPTAPSYVALGNAELALGHRSEAIRSYQAALRLFPGSFAAHVNLAEALRRDRQLEQAQRQADLAAQLYPYHPKLTKLRERLQHTRFVQDSL